MLLLALVGLAAGVAVASPKRVKPDYDGRGNPDAKAGSWVLWIPRVMMSPLYLVNEYVLRRPLGAREVCVELERRAPTVLARHKDPLASVTTVLNRLVDYGEARSLNNDRGRRVWEWVSETESVAKSAAEDTMAARNSA